jgi:hypothetical protein
MERESTALINEFDRSEELVQDYEPSVADAFLLPERNWERIIDSYNAANKRKFPFTPLQCKLILEYVKKGQPVKNIFKSIGVSIQKYTHLQTKFGELEDELEQLRSKPSLNEEETDRFHSIMRHPLRILLSDVERADGIADLIIWERFNDFADRANDLMAMRMKARFKDTFAEKTSDAGGFNVSINIGGNWIEDL